LNIPVTNYFVNERRLNNVKTIFLYYNKDKRDISCRRMENYHFVCSNCKSVYGLREKEYKHGEEKRVSRMCWFCGSREITDSSGKIISHRINKNFRDRFVENLPEFLRGIELYEGVII
jgi:hypothetical protein